VNRRLVVSCVLASTAFVRAAFADAGIDGSADGSVEGGRSADAGRDVGSFSYEPAGNLVAGSGRGRADSVVYAPDIRFPMEIGPAFANSQVWGVGGFSGPSGSQCDARNYSYPWRDNYCETRDWDMPLCPAGVGHQGQDIRAPSCDKARYWVVAVADGTITSVGSYSVYLTDAAGTRYDYLHMSDVQVKVADRVKRGDRVGKVSNEFGGAATTVHLHFNMRQNVQGLGAVFVPPYTSLVKAYEELLNPTIDAGLPPPPPPPPPPDSGEPTADGGSPPASPPEEAGCSCRTSSSSSGSLTFVLGVALALSSIARRRTGR
jgi:murein DD-endopeptidase MepM/ murein hydrolase activator NlpD